MASRVGGAAAGAATAAAAGAASSRRASGRAFSLGLVVVAGAYWWMNFKRKPVEVVGGSSPVRVRPAHVPLADRIDQDKLAAYLATAATAAPATSGGAGAGAGAGDGAGDSNGGTPTQVAGR